MSKRNLMSGKDRELHDMAEQYENAKKENKSIYLDADDLADLADWYAMHYQYDKADEAVEYGLKLHPDNTALLIEQAYMFLDANQREEAKKVMERITEDTSEAKILRANLLMGDDKIEEAEMLLDTIEDKDELGNIIDVTYMYLDLGTPELAQPWLERGAERYAKNESYLAVKGDCYHAQGLCEEAADIFNKLIDKNPYSAPYWFGLAGCYFDMQMFDKVVEACDYALVADDEYATAYVLRGHAFFQLGNNERAIEDFLAAKERNAISHSFVNTFIGIDKIDKGEWEEAYYHFEEVIQSQQDCPLLPLSAVYANAALCLHKMGKKRKVHQYCKKAREIAPEEIDSYLIEGRIYLGEGNFEKGILSWSKALQYDPSAETWNDIAMCSLDEGYPFYAKLAFERIKELDPDFEGINEKLTSIYMLLKDRENALKSNQQCKRPLPTKELERLQDLIEKVNEDELSEVLKEILKQLTTR